MLWLTRGVTREVAQDVAEPRVSDHILLVLMCHFGLFLVRTLTCSPTSLTSSVVRLPTSTLTNSAGSLSRMSICRSPYSRSFLPIELDTAEKKAMTAASVVDALMGRLQAGRAPTAAWGLSPYVSSTWSTAACSRGLGVPLYVLDPAFKSSKRMAGGKWDRGSIVGMRR